MDGNNLRNNQFDEHVKEMKAFELKTYKDDRILRDQISKKDSKVNESLQDLIYDMKDVKRTC